MEDKDFGIHSAAQTGDSKIRNRIAVALTRLYKQSGSVRQYPEGPTAECWATPTAPLAFPLSTSTDNRHSVLLISALLQLAERGSA